MGSRTATNEKALAWVAKSGANASTGTFADATAFGEMIFNCAKGIATLDILGLCGEENLNGKILIDLANPLDSSPGGLPSLS
eukprot:gene39611-52239_t